MTAVLQPLAQKKSTKLFSSLGFWSIIFCFIMIFVLGLIKIYSPDLGFHLKSAEWILNNKQFIYTDTFSYGSDGHKYFDVQWLYQLIVYSLYRRSESLLIIVNALLIAFSFVLVSIRFMHKTGVQRNSILVGAFVLLAVIFIQPLTFEIRPYVFSWIFLNLILLILESYKKGEKKSLIFLPLVILLWANMHSLAILGLVSIAIYNVGMYLENKKIDRRFLMYSLISLVAYLINPYFINGLLYPLSQFGIISGNSLFKSYLGELRSPFTVEEIKMLGSNYFTSPLLIVHLSAIISLMTIFQAIKQKQFTDALLMIAYLLLLYMAHRNYGIFLWVSLPMFAQYFIKLLSREKNKKAAEKNIIKEKPKPAITDFAVSAKAKLFRRLAIASIIIALLISVSSITDSYPILRHSPYRFGFTNDKDQLPVEATAFLNMNNIHGKLLNHLDFGGYLMAHYNEKVFIDGRMDLYEDDFFKDYYESLTQKNGMKKLLSKYNPDVVVFPYMKASLWWSYFLLNNRQSGYKPVYFDGLSVIYLKSVNYPTIAELNQQSILIGLDSSVLSRENQVISQSQKSSFETLLNGIWKKQRFSIADQNKAAYCFTNGFDSAAKYFSLTGIEHSTVNTPNIYKNLSIYYQEKKMYDKAEQCENKSE